VVECVLDESALPDEEVRVLFLADAIAERLPIVGDLRSTDESRKGGSIRLGLWSAAQTPRASARHMVLYTDADLSTHLGQIGLLAPPLTKPSCHVAIGSRREVGSVVVKSGMRNDRGKLFVYLWKRLLPQLRGIVDTQCGFKAFDVPRLARWIGDTHDSGFSFDVELLLRAHMGQPGSLTKVPVAWIDSEAASTTAELEPYLPMLQSIADMYRTFVPHEPDADAFARLIDGLGAEMFRTLVANIPAEITDRQPRDFDAYEGVTAQDLARVVGLDL